MASDPDSVAKRQLTVKQIETQCASVIPLAHYIGITVDVNTAQQKATMFRQEQDKTNEAIRNSMKQRTEEALRDIHQKTQTGVGLPLRNQRNEPSKGGCCQLS